MILSFFLRVLGRKDADKRIIDYNFTGQERFQVGVKNWFPKEYIAYNHKFIIKKLFKISSE